MRITHRALSSQLSALSLGLVLLAGCAAPGSRPQRGGSTTTTLGGATAPTSTVTTAPENPQTPTTTTLEKTTERTYATAAEPTPVAGSASDPTAPARSALAATPGSGSQPSALSSQPPSAPRIAREVITERATTQIGTSQDLAGIVKAWGAAGAAHYKSLVWAFALGVAAWRAWKREWPLIAAVLGVGAVLSLLVAWWIGPVAAGAAALVWAAYHVARGSLPLPPIGTP